MFYLARSTFCLTCKLSIDSHQFPSEWKAAKVFPLFKKGQRSLLDNYRPISILPVVSKLMERILYHQIYEYFDQQNLFQTSNLVLGLIIPQLQHCWIVRTNGMPKWTLAFLDLKKAFDTVNHGILLSKLQMHGIISKAINLMRSYLTHRTQTCQLTNVYSGEREVICGILQGSILDLLLFLIYINELPNALNAKLLG